MLASSAKNGRTLARRPANQQREKESAHFLALETRARIFWPRHQSACAVGTPRLAVQRAAFLRQRGRGLAQRACSKASLRWLCSS
eukprot:363393-Chlamydomonas_euryale.AAC.6